MMKRWQIPRNTGTASGDTTDIWSWTYQASDNSAETNTLDTQLDLERDYQRLPDGAQIIVKVSVRSWLNAPAVHGEIA